MSFRKDLADRLDPIIADHLRLASRNKGRGRADRAGYHHDAVVTLNCIQAAALRQEPSVEQIARVIHAEVAGDNPDELIHHPWQKSWEPPERLRWTQWVEAAQAIASLYRGKP